MKDFNSQRFVSLLKYDMAANGKQFLQMFGVAFLIIIVLWSFFVYAKWPFDLFVAQGFIGSSWVGSFCVYWVAFFMATSSLVVNRYCEARTATTFNMLPATYLEKGCLALLELFLIGFVMPLLFYVFTYTVFYCIIRMLTGLGEYNPFSVIPVIIKSFYSTPQPYSEMPEEVKMGLFIPKLLVTLIPVSSCIVVMIYEIIVTFFRNRRVQIKALFVNFLLYCAIGLALLFSAVTFANNVDHEAWVRFSNEHVMMFFYFVDTLILLQIPLLAFLVWWFFRRLHYKEIR